MNKESYDLIVDGNNIPEPYQLWWYTVPNEHDTDTTAPKTRPIIILETYFDKTDFYDENFYPSKVYPDFVIGTSQMRYIDWKGTFAISDSEELKELGLDRTTIFRFDQVVERNSKSNVSVADIMNNGVFVCKIPDKIHIRMRDYINNLHLPNLILPESLMIESKADIQSFISKFGQDTYDTFKKSSQRLKNAGLSADMLTYVRDETMSKDKLDKILFNLANHIKTVKSDMSKIGGKYKFLGSAKGYDVYQPLDAESSMNLGVGSGWCTTGRYGHYGEKNFNPSLKDARKHWNDYTSKGVKFFYFLQHGKGKYALALYPKILNVNKYVDDNSRFIKKANIELYDAPDNLDYKDLNKLPLELVPEKIVFDETKLKKDDSGKLTLSEDGKILIEADTGIESAKIPDGVTSIREWAFSDCSSLESIVIPDSVTSIGTFAFFYCASLQSVTIPNSVTSIKKDAFYYCRSLKSVNIPDSVTSIGDGAFYNCRSLKSVNIPDSVTSIGMRSFSYCNSLESITVGPKIYDRMKNEYGDIVHSSDENDESVTESMILESKADIQSFISKFGEDTYAEFRKSSQRLKNAGLSSDMLSYVRDKTMSKDKLDKILFNLANHIKTDKNDMSKIDGKYKYLGSAKGYDVYQPLDAESSMNLGVGSGWCTTGRYGHYGEENFKPSLKDAEKHWNDYTERGVKFYYFLQHGEGKYALALYPKILDVNDVESGYYVKRTNIELYDAPDKLAYDAIKDLPLNLVPEKIVLDMTKLKTDTSGKLTLSKDGKTLMKADTGIENVKIPDGVTSISNNAFFNCQSLKSVNIPDSVTSIGAGAFYDCQSLESVNIPNSVTSIGDSAFSGCSSLKSIVIPDSVTSIGMFAFSHCSSLESIVIPDSVTSIGAVAFADCNHLQSITIPDSVTSIGDSAFDECELLNSIIVGPKLYDEMKMKYGDIVHSSDENDEGTISEGMHRNRMVASMNSDSVTDEGNENTSGFEVHLVPDKNRLSGIEKLHHDFPEAFYIRADGTQIPVENHLDYDDRHPGVADSDGYVRVRISVPKLIEFPSCPTHEQLDGISEAVMRMGHSGTVALNVHNSVLPGEEISLSGDSVRKVMEAIDEMTYDC